MHDAVVSPETHPAEIRPPRRRGRPRDDTADRRILEAAGQLILERGFDKVTVDEVAARARAGKATVYRRWASKEDLAVAALGELYHQELPVPDTGSVREDLQQYYHQILEFANSASGAAYIRMTLSESLRDERIAQLHRDALGSREDQIVRLLERGVERGELRPDARLDFAVHWIRGLITQCLVVGRTPPATDDVDDIIEFVFNGIGR